jgi:hypothetical protein
MAPVFFEGRGTELFMRKLSSFSDFLKWFVGNAASSAAVIRTAA